MSQTAFQCPNCGKIYPAFETRQRRLNTIEKIGKHLYISDPTCPNCGALLEEKHYRKHNNPTADLAGGF